MGILRGDEFGKERACLSFISGSENMSTWRYRHYDKKKRNPGQTIAHVSAPY
jgi:hypothetical protein